MTERRRLTGWGAGGREASWWRRGYDPIGRHTLVAVVLGVLLTALVGAAFDPLNLRTSDDLDRAEDTAYELAYAAIADAGYDDGLVYGEVEALGRAIIGEGVGAESDYARRFADGWRDGWNDALAAMRDTAKAEGLPPGYTEFRILDETASRD